MAGTNTGMPRFDRRIARIVGWLALPLAAAATAACVSEEEVEAEIEDANFCESVDECVEIYPGCPLGCSHFVNEAELERIEDLVERYFDQHPEENCAYDCIGHGEVRCEDGRCVADPLE